MSTVFKSCLVKHVYPLCGLASRSFTTTSRCLAEEPIVLNKLKRGTGGRASFNGMVVTVFGATGYLGRVLMTHLAKTGTQIIVPYRCDPHMIRGMKVVGDLGQILFLPYNLKDDECLRKAMKYSDVVINLIGTEFDTRNFTIEEVHIDAACRIAKISKEIGVEQLVHVSALCQNKNPQKYVRKPSRFMISKAIGEEEVLRERPDATIFRPAEIWGPLDRFLCYFASKPRRHNGIQTVFVPLWSYGEHTIKQPVYVGDIARGIINCLHNPESLGQIYEAVGPHRYRLDDIVKWIYLICRYLPSEIYIIPMNPWFLARTYIYENLGRINPYLTFERLERESATDILSGCPTLDDLNVKLTKLEDRINHIVYLFRRDYNYWHAVGEFPEPPPPPIQFQ
ncbi:NADH dehydrogenase [ubiquinone] 1 alpha subcomplex subunit 9 isoform 2 [Schistosoma japonicum]|uniref:NADH dehydrogenase [ubiquinone] 1 alpha subcomplex subunit 9, mitochondrial n=3 Tax=Schistosoma japonicum TaxID=6182 RepID=Q5DCH0_SCHJA|nr:SJCHGC05906 protein [Schistosoma japonicum]TNN15622.1 NADH dehydrogenase [ubiquinone] 1 alpha subcomplex subunit 9 isoform 2 [Schistosoma japonicum]